MIKLFIKECLLFGSSEGINQLLGMAAWVSSAVLMYMLILIYLS